MDQADKEEPVKKFPSLMAKPYLYTVADKMVNESLLGLVKSRRMIITWLCCAICLWDALFFEGRFNALISKKEEDSDELVRRCKFIYENIPSDKMPVKPVIHYKYTELNIPSIGSTIKGFAQGPDQLRQRGCSRIFADEIAFWENARKTFVAMKPTLEGGGKVVLVSTRYPGFFKEIVEDEAA
jgi:hypothetical protein